MNILGISAGFHDAGASVINTSGDILFASHSERYSKQKHDSNLCEGIVEEAHEAAYQLMEGKFNELVNKPLE